MAKRLKTNRMARMIHLTILHNTMQHLNILQEIHHRMMMMMMMMDMTMKKR